MARREGDAQYNLRLGRPLLKKLQDAAKAKKRSLNLEILNRVAFTFRPDIERRMEVEGFASVLDEMAEAWTRMAAESINKDDRDYALEMAESAKNLAASQRDQSKGDRS